MEKQVKLEFGVDIDDADPLVVRVWDGEKSYPCRKVPKCMRHPCLTSKRYYIVECRPYCGRTAGGYTPKQAIDEWNRLIAYELRL